MRSGRSVRPSAKAGSTAAWRRQGRDAKPPKRDAQRKGGQSESTEEECTRWARRTRLLRVLPVLRVGTKDASTDRDGNGHQPHEHCRHGSSEIDMVLAKS